MKTLQDEVTKMFEKNVCYNDEEYEVFYNDKHWEQLQDDLTIFIEKRLEDQKKMFLKMAQGGC